LPWGIADIGFDGPRDRILAAAGYEALIEIDPSSGVRTVASGSFEGTGPMTIDPNSLSVGSSGQRALVLGEDGDLVEVDLPSGNRLPRSRGSREDELGAGPYLERYGRVVFDEANNRAFVLASRGSNFVAVVDLVSGDRAVLSR
jgi:hypothetical protein